LKRLDSRATLLLPKHCRGTRNKEIAMRMSLLLAGMTLGAVAFSAPTIAASKSPSAEATRPAKASATKRKRTRAYRAVVRQPQTQIACTRYGCNPIPPGCRIETEYNLRSWNPSGFDAVVCPPR
jgi:hypothetical protein